MKVRVSLGIYRKKKLEMEIYPICENIVDNTNSDGGTMHRLGRTCFVDYNVEQMKSLLFCGNEESRNYFPLS